MNQKKLDRINELYHKSQSEGLTNAEKEEQRLLREEYVALVRANLRGQLNNISIQNPDGTIENLGEKYGKKKL
ncbi:MAG: DUF896 domain-containing protein [Lachnospiraceae bacterium]|nr:DUF896 domain-containing protein [Lachnospiraceae bacterium]